jgi:hypothetical protein
MKLPTSEPAAILALVIALFVGVFVAPPPRRVAGGCRGVAWPARPC